MRFFYSTILLPKQKSGVKKFPKWNSQLSAGILTLSSVFLFNRWYFMLLSSFTKKRNLDPHSKSLFATPDTLLIISFIFFKYLISLRITLWCVNINVFCIFAFKCLSQLIILAMTILLCYFITMVTPLKIWKIGHIYL